MSSDARARMLSILERAKAGNQESLGELLTLLSWFNGKWNF